MIMNMYVVHDKVAEESGPVFEAKNDGVAFRQFQQLALNTNGANPDDFTLLCIGSVDHEKNSVGVLPIAKEVIANLGMEDSVDE